MDNRVATASFSARLGALVRLVRPKQWSKNGFVLAPLIFSAEFMNGTSVTRAFGAVALFSLAASSTYILNDLHDIERDRAHPQKRHKRPLASGDVSVPAAIALLIALYGLVALGLVALPQMAAAVLAYVALNVLYTFVLKHQPVVDIFTIAIGFVLRVYAGAMAISVPVSSWMFITTLCLALYLAAVKRRQELTQAGTEGRKVLERYPLALVERYAEISATGALVFYSMFVMSAKPQLVVTVPVVLFGLFRYWYVVEALDGGESPTDALLSDWQLLATVVAWVGACVYALWPAAA